MGNEVGFTVDFKEKIRATIIEATMNLFPKEEMDSLVNAEIKAFFEASSEHSGSLVTPWRKLVWDTLYTYMKPKIQAVFTEEESEVKKQLDEWFVAQLTPNIKDGYKTIFAQVGISGGAAMYNTMMKQSAEATRMMMSNGLVAAGVSYNIAYNLPFFDCSVTPILIKNPETRI